jgi:hypothetical protein
MKGDNMTNSKRDIPKKEIEAMRNLIDAGQRMIRKIPKGAERDAAKAAFEPTRLEYLRRIEQIYAVAEKQRIKHNAQVLAKNAVHVNITDQELMPRIGKIHMFEYISGQKKDGVKPFKVITRTRQKYNDKNKMVDGRLEFFTKDEMAPYPMLTH